MSLMTSAIVSDQEVIEIVESRAGAETRTEGRDRCVEEAVPYAYTVIPWVVHMTGHCEYWES